MCLCFFSLSSLFSLLSLFSLSLSAPSNHILLSDMKEMPFANRDQLVKKYLAQFGKSFDSAQLAKIVSAPQTGMSLLSVLSIICRYSFHSRKSSVFEGVAGRGARSRCL